MQKMQNITCPKKHSKPEIDEALQYAELNGWRVEVGGAHAWGKIYCPYKDKECRCGELCIASVWSTPRNDMNHDRQIRRVVDKLCVASEEISAGPSVRINHAEI